MKKKEKIINLIFIIVIILLIIIIPINSICAMISQIALPFVSIAFIFIYLYRKN